MTRISVRGLIKARPAEIYRLKGDHRKKKVREEQPEVNEEENEEDTQKENEGRSYLTQAEDASWATWTEEERREAIRILGPRPWLTVVYDSETIVSTVSDVIRNGQPLHVGYFEVRGIGVREAKSRLDKGLLKPEDRHRVHRCGFVLPDANELIALSDGSPTLLYAGYDLTPDREAVEEYAALHSYRWSDDHIDKYGKIQVLSKQQFINDIFYGYGYGWDTYVTGARIVGHNPFYDFTRLITDVWTPEGTLIRGVREAHKDAFRGGFSSKLCDCPYEDCFKHPRIMCVKLGRFKMRYRFEKVKFAKTGLKRTYRGRFLNTQTLGLALRRSGSAELRAMGENFNARVLKFDEEHSPDFKAPIDENFLDYLVNDVRATYWLSVAELEDFAAFDLPMYPESVYSAASLSKKMLAKFGFPTSDKHTWDVSDEITGHAISTYFGGRSDVCYRGEVAEIIHLDFKSQYGAAGEHMGMQQFATAKNVTTEECTGWCREFLSRSHDELLASLQRPDAWRSLPVIVQIIPDGKLVLPIRADFGGGGVLNIGQCRVKYNGRLWYTLADVLSGVIRGGAVPTITQAIRFIPSGIVEGLHADTLLGYAIDPTQHVFWTEVLKIRRKIKKTAQDAKDRGDIDTYNRLTAQHNALKETGLAGVYGLLEELNERVYEGKALTLDVYALSHTTRLGNVVENPGPYFMGALGTFVPAGGRALLSLAEALAADRGLSYAFMDTDSITLMRPSGMSREEFRRLTQEIVDYFIPLNPFEFGTSLLAYEDQNYVIDESDLNRVLDGNFSPLYCIATSSKRYVEFNLRDDGTPILRKFTSHGLGAYGRKEEDAVPDDVPPPHTYKLDKKTGEHIPDSSPLGGAPWIYRQQYLMVEAKLRGQYRDGKRLATTYRTQPYIPRSDESLTDYAMSSFNLETYGDYKRCKHLRGMRPGGFITVYHALENEEEKNKIEGDVIVTTTGVKRDSTKEEDETRAQTNVLNPTAKAMYSPFAGSAAEAREYFASGLIKRIADDSVVSDEGEIKTMWHVVYPYFIHFERKAANPGGYGALGIRDVEVTGIDVIGTERHRLANAAAEETGGILGDYSEEGGYRYGANDEVESPKLNLSSLFDEELRYIVAASCLSPKSVYNVLRSAHEMKPYTRESLVLTMRLLDADNSQSIVGCFDELNAERLAKLLRIPMKDAQMRIKGQATWTFAQRQKLIDYMVKVRRLRNRQENAK